MLPKSKLITLILPGHKTKDIVKALAKEKGIITANRSSARGSSYTSMFDWQEMEILTIMVEEDRAEEIFFYLYDMAEIDKRSSGMIYQHALITSSTYSLPHELEEN